MVILGSMTPIFEALETGVVADHQLLVCREQGIPATQTLGRQITECANAYRGGPHDAELLGLTAREYDYNIVINSGLYAGPKKALLSLDNEIRAMMPEAAFWESHALPDVWWREQAIMNLALARLNSAVVLDWSYNLQTAS